MKDLATLPPMIGGHLLAELQAAGISAGSSDLTADSMGSLQEFVTPSMTIWIEDAAQLEKARAILARILKSLGMDDASGALHGQGEIRAEQAPSDSPEGLIDDSGNHPHHFEGDSLAGEDV